MTITAASGLYVVLKIKAVFSITSPTELRSLTMCQLGFIIIEALSFQFCRKRPITYVCCLLGDLVIDFYSSLATTKVQKQVPQKNEELYTPSIRGGTKPHDVKTSYSPIEHETNSHSIPTQNV
jgi:hypothetical protein